MKIQGQEDLAMKYIKLGTGIFVVLISIYMVKPNF